MIHANAGHNNKLQIYFILSNQAKPEVCYHPTE